MFLDLLSYNFICFRDVSAYAAELTLLVGILFFLFVVPAYNLTNKVLSNGQTLIRRSSQDFSYGSKLQLRTHKSNFFKSSRRKFSTVPQKPKQHLNLKGSINNLVQAFINNTRQQQEILLVSYSLFLIVAAYSCFGAAPVFLALVILQWLLIILFVIKSFLKYISLKKNYKFYLSSSYFFFCIVLCFYGYYRFLLLLALFLLITFFKGYLSKKREEGVKVGTAMKNLDLFFKDMATTEHHYQKEFYLFDVIRKLNFLIGAFVGCILYLVVKGYLPSFDPYTLPLITAAQILFFVVCFNLFLLFFIHVIIIFYCNPPTTLKVAALCVGCMGVGVGGLVVMF